MSIAFIAGIAVLVVIALIAVSQRSGPRITQITRRREAEGGGRGIDRHLGARHAARQGDADAVEEGIARSENDDRSAAGCKHHLDRPLEGAEPAVTLAVDGGIGELQMPCAAEDELGLFDRALGRVAETR